MSIDMDKLEQTNARAGLPPQAPRRVLTERCDGSPRVLVVVRGGLVVSVMSEEPVEVGIVDFDNAEVGGDPFSGWGDSDPWESMAPEVMEQIEGEPRFTCKVCEQEKPLCLRDPVMEDTCDECGEQALNAEDAEEASDDAENGG